MGTPFSFVDLRGQSVFLLNFVRQTSRSEELEQVRFFSRLLGLFIIVRIVDAFHEYFAVIDGVKVIVCCQLVFGVGVFV